MPGVWRRRAAVLLCVAQAAAVEQTVFGAAGLLDGDPALPRRVRWIVDHSSISPAAVAATAYETGTPMPVASTVQQLLRLAAAMGIADAGLSAFIDVLQTPRSAPGQ